MTDQGELPPKARAPDRSRDSVDDTDVCHVPLVDERVIKCSSESACSVRIHSSLVAVKGELTQFNVLA